MKILVSAHYSRKKAFPSEILSVICDYIRIPIVFHAQSHGYQCYTNETRNMLYRHVGFKHGSSVGMSEQPLQSVYAEHAKYVNNLNGKRRVKGYQLRIASQIRKNIESKNQNVVKFEFGVTTLSPSEMQKMTHFDVR